MPFLINLSQDLQRKFEMYAIEVKNVNKKFKIPHEKKTTVFERLVGLVSKKNGYEEFHALKNISFSVCRGESVGIIGDNGSGKTTLLSILANVLRPDNGAIKLNGRITPFLELGIGFNPEMTAIENIRVYGMIMGLSKKEINQKMDDILNFAGLMNFKDTKFKNYSSGMQVRLAFSTAIQTKPDILLVDEILAVGDMEFQQKCFDVFNNFKKSGVTLILVSHDLGAIRRYCEKTLFLNKGEQVAFGPTNKIIDSYVYMPKGQRTEEKEKPEAPPNIYEGKAMITDVQFLDKNNNETDRFMSGDLINICISYSCWEKIDKPLFGIAIYDEKDTYLFGTNNALKNYNIRDAYGEGKIIFEIKSIPFLQGRFYVSIGLRDGHDMKSIYDLKAKAYSIIVVNTTKDTGTVFVPSKWCLPKDKN